MRQLVGKIAIVTGGAAGFGEGIVRAYVAEGARVVIADLDVAKGEALARELGEATVFVRCDVSSGPDVQALVQACVERFGAPGIVVNNAILVVDGALTRIRGGMELGLSVAESVHGRLRPIMMTTCTSLAGLLPLVLFPGSGSELYRGVGSVVLGGLALSTVLTIFVVPAVFTLLWRLRRVLRPSRVEPGTELAAP